MNRNIKIVTHSGGFHADDVFATATLLILLGADNTYVVRSREPKDIEGADYVIDVGSEYDELFNHFDHHQKGGAGERDNGVSYASFGLVWKKFGTELAGSKKAAMFVDRLLVQPIDALDTGLEISKPVIEGVYPYDISIAISSFKPMWEEAGRDMRTSFDEAVSMAKVILEREIVRAKHNMEAKEAIQKIYDTTEDKRLLILEDDRRWDRMLVMSLTEKEPDILYVVRKHEDGTWQVFTAVDDVTVYKNRKNLPESWAGLSGKELADLTGVSDAQFCHSNLFMCVAGSKEGALKLVKLALDS